MKATIPLLAVFLLVACSDGSLDTHSLGTSRVPDNNVLNEPVKALEKAEQLEQMLTNTHANRGRELEQQNR